MPPPVHDGACGIQLSGPVPASLAAAFTASHPGAEELVLHIQVSDYVILFVVRVPAFKAFKAVLRFTALKEGLLIGALVTAVCADILILVLGKELLALYLHIVKKIFVSLPAVYPVFILIEIVVKTHNSVPEPGCALTCSLLHTGQYAFLKPLNIVMNSILRSRPMVQFSM